MKSLILQYHKQVNKVMLDIQAEKYSVIEALTKVNDINLIQKVKDILKQENRISIEQYNKELDEADAEIDRGEFTTHQELKREMKEW